jgi:hypothetical protein
MATPRPSFTRTGAFFWFTHTIMLLFAVITLKTSPYISAFIHKTQEKVIDNYVNK